VKKGTRDPIIGGLIKKFSLMYCGIQPSEINNIPIDEMDLFNIYFNELIKIQMGVGKNDRRY
jgi:hypothetical protein